MGGGHPSERLLVLWVEYRASELPDDCVGRELDGVDLMMLEATTAGCVSMYVAGGCTLDERKRRMLRTAVEQLRFVVARVDGEARVHFDRLRQAAERVLLELFDAH